MPRSFAVLVLAGFLAACGQPAPSGQPFPSGDPVPLLTGRAPGVPEGSCYTFQTTGTLIVDRVHGTAVVDDTGQYDAPVTTPIMWRPGFTGWPVGSEIEVRDPTGNIVATTGHRYTIGGGFVDLPSGVHVFFACSGVTER